MSGLAGSEDAKAIQDVVSPTRSASIGATSALIYL